MVLSTPWFWIIVVLGLVLSFMFKPDIGENLLGVAKDNLSSFTTPGTLQYHVISGSVDLARREYAERRVVMWTRDTSRQLLLKKEELARDASWISTQLTGLHTLKEIHTLESTEVDVVVTENWNQYSSKLVKNLCKDAPATTVQQLTDKLDMVPLKEVGMFEIIEVKLSYESGGHQYMSSIKVATLKSSNSILVASVLFGKMWTEQANYHLSQEWWIANDNRVRNFLHHGANERLAEALQSENGLIAAKNSVHVM